MDTIDGNAGTLQGGAFFTPARVGRGFTFDSNDDRVVVPNNGNLNLAAPGFTVEFWMQGLKNQPAALYAVIEKSHGFGDFTGWAMQGDNASGTIAFVVGNGSGFPAVGSGVDVLDGSFHHVAGVWNGASILLYVDGTLRGSAALTTPASNSRQLNLGFAWGGGVAQRFFRGSIDEAAIYARALSATEVQSIYAAAGSGKCRPCGDGILNPDEACDDGNTVAGDCCSATCQTEASGAPCGDDGAACTLDSCNAVGRCIHPGNGTCDCVPRPAGIVSWWRAEGNTSDFTDGNAGAASAALAYGSALSGQGFDTRAGGSVTIGHNNNLNVNSPGFTAEFWMKGNKSQSEALFDVLDKSHDGTDGAGWTFQGERASGRLSFLVGGIAGNNFATVTSGVDVLDDQFHHVAGVWDGSEIRLYVDGESYGRYALGTPKNNTRALHIAIWTSGRQFKGFVDEVAVYARALTEQEIREIFSAAAAAKCTSPCGNGALDTSEQCDDGNKANGDCCSATCQFEATGSVCRPSAGSCDVPETCSGVSMLCPPDVKATDACRPAAGTCDIVETCDGVGNDCPPDAIEATGVVCRAAAGACDVEEACDGATSACPQDTFQAAGITCRLAVGACDLPEACTGSDPACPADAYHAVGTTCRATAGVCDPSESCSGLSPTCPPDARSTSVCRPATGACDATEFCTGIDAACPADVAAADGTPCDDGDVCTAPDQCLTGLCAGAPDPASCADDADGDGVEDDADACPATPGFADRQGCPIGDANLVELHLVDQRKSGACPGNAGSCKLPIAGALVRVFDRNAPAFQSAYATKNPSGRIYDQVFENDIGRVGTCTADAGGRCTAGEESLGDYLVIVRWTDTSANHLVYSGKPKSPSDFVDTNGDGLPDLASKDFQIVKLIRRDGTTQVTGGSKIVVTGSFLEIVHPDFAVWEDAASGFVYPFVFTSDSDWTVDVCASVPTGYDVVGVYDDDGNFHSSIDCLQTFVTNETRAIAFEVIETGSPEPKLFTRLHVKGGHLGRHKRLRIEVPGERRYRGQRLLESAGPACWARVEYSS